jgi:hypothetical protein
VTSRTPAAPAERAAVPRWALVGGLIGGLMLFTMIVLLSLTLAQLHDSGGHIEAQDKKLAAIFRAGRPLAARADSLAGDVGPALDDARSLVDPLIKSHTGDDLAGVLDSFPALDSSLRHLSAEAVPVLDAALPVLDEAVPVLAQSDPATVLSVLASVGQLAAALSQDDRLVRLVDGASAALADVSDHDLVGRLAKTTTRIRKLLAVQRETRSLQEQSLAVQTKSLNIQQRTLDHVRSLDEKTLGETPLP